MSKREVYRTTLTEQGLVTLGAFVGPIWTGDVEGEWLTTEQALAKFVGIAAKWCCNFDDVLSTGPERAEIYWYRRRLENPRWDNRRQLTLRTEMAYVAVV